MEPVVSATSPPRRGGFAPPSIRYPPAPAKVSPSTQQILDSDCASSSVLKGDSNPLIAHVTASAPMVANDDGSMTKRSFLIGAPHNAATTTSPANNWTDVASAKAIPPDTSQGDATNAAGTARMYSRTNNLSFLDSLMGTQPPAVATLQAQSRHEVNPNFSLLNGTTAGGNMDMSAAEIPFDLASVKTLNVDAMEKTTAVGENGQRGSNDPLLGDQPPPDPTTEAHTADVTAPIVLQDAKAITPSGVTEPSTRGPWLVGGGAPHDPVVSPNGAERHNPHLKTTFAPTQRSTGTPVASIQSMTTPFPDDQRQICTRKGDVPNVLVSRSGTAPDGHVSKTADPSQGGVPVSSAPMRAPRSEQPVVIRPTAPLLQNGSVSLQKPHVPWDNKPVRDPGKLQDGKAAIPTADVNSKQDMDVVLIDESDDDNADAVESTKNARTHPKRPRSPQIIDLEDEMQLRSLESVKPARHHIRNVGPRHGTPGLPLPGTPGVDQASKVHVSRGGALFLVENDGTVNIFDSDDENELQEQQRLESTADGITALPPGQTVQSQKDHQIGVPFRVKHEQERRETKDAVSRNMMQFAPDISPIRDDELAWHPGRTVNEPLAPKAPSATGSASLVATASSALEDTNPIRDDELAWQPKRPVGAYGAPVAPAGVSLGNPANDDLCAQSERCSGGAVSAYAFGHSNVSGIQMPPDATRKISFRSTHGHGEEPRPEFIAVPSAKIGHNQPVYESAKLTSAVPMDAPFPDIQSREDNPQNEDVLSERGLKTLMKQNEITADATEEADTPEGLTVTLMPHQKRALAWMSKREEPIHADEDIVAVDEECLGGILADDQGLGKTVTMIALLLRSAPTDSEDSDEDSERLSTDKSSSIDDFIVDSSVGERTSKPWRTLIVCPPSLINQWNEELMLRTKASHRPTVYIYHGAKREKSVAKLKRFDIVLTTYATLVNEYPKVLKNHPEFKMRKAEKLKLPCRSSGPLCQISWTRIVLDESQHVKNRSTESWNAVMSLEAERRWCLSGTPIQNNVDDLYALFCFIRYHFVQNYEMWNKTWKKKLESPFQSVRNRTFKQFQAITGVVLLRRTKLDEINGRPLINLPPRSTEVKELDFDEEDEILFYQGVAAKTIIRFNKYLAEGSISANYSNILLMLLRLRQASSHPFLIQYAQMQGRGEIDRDHDPRYVTSYTTEELEEAMELAVAGHSLIELLDERVREIITKFLVPPEKGQAAPTTFACSYCRDASLWAHGVVLPCGEVICPRCCTLVKRQGMCLRCQNSITERESADVFINLDHLRREVHAQTILSSSAVRSFTAAEFKTLLKDEAHRRRQCEQPGGNASESVIDAVTDDLASTEQGRNHPDPQNKPGKEGRSEHGKKKLLQALSQHSTKIRVIIGELNKIRERGAGEKTLVFSQWTSMLDIVEFHARVNGHDTCRLDGSMTVSARQVQIREFRESTTKNVFLISLHAGGTGLNLTASNHVILCDVWWNPAVEEQAIDRAHRIGQTKPVHVIRFRMKGTVEDDIYKICETKRSMMNGTLGEKGKQNLGRTRLARDELMSLFSGAAAGVVRNAGADRAAAEAARSILNLSG